MAEAVYVRLPENETAKQRLFELGQYYEQAGDIRKACFVYLEAGNCPGAMEHAEICAEIIFQEAESLMVRGKWEEAKKIYAIIPE